jgi:hypothetical protein
MKLGIPVAAIGGVSMLALAGAAHAEHSQVGTCPATADQKQRECPVNLTLGQDYALRKNADTVGCVEMVNPQRSTFVTICDFDTQSLSKEFRAGQTGTFWIRIRPNEDGLNANGTLYTDCKDANNTQCRLPLTGQKTSDAAGRTDLDRFKTAILRKGRTYTLTVTGTSQSSRTDFIVQTGTGNVLRTGYAYRNTKTVRFTAPANAPLYVRAGRGGPYTLTLR